MIPQVGNPVFNGVPTALGGTIHISPYVSNIAIAVPSYTNNYYAPRPVIENDRFVCKKPTNMMNWKLAESIDIEKMQRSSDVNSIKYLITQFKEAKIDENDTKNFASVGAYKAFRSMQIAVQYLLEENQKLLDQFQYISDEPGQKLLTQYNENLSKAEESIKKRDEKINELKNQVSKLCDERETVKHEILRLRKKLHHTRELNTDLRKRLEETELGVANTTLVREKYKDIRKRLRA